MVFLHLPEPKGWLSKLKIRISLACALLIPLLIIGFGGESCSSGQEPEHLSTVHRREWRADVRSASGRSQWVGHPRLGGRHLRQLAN